MPVKDVGFRIKIPMARETSDTQRALNKQRDTVVGMHKKELPKLTKATKEYLKTAKEAANDAERATEQLGMTFSRSMENGLRSLNRFTTGVGHLRERILNLKTALAGTAIGGAAIWAGRTLYEQGKQQLATYGRIKREFGADESATFASIATPAGKRAGLGDDDTIRALIPFRERLDDIEAGAQFRGQKSKLTATQAAALRTRNLTFGANLLSRVATLAPEIDPEQAGSVLADALSGPEGVRRLISEFNLSKRSKTVAAANEKGDVFGFLRADERQQYGITKKGQYLEQGDLVNILLERSGLTEDAAEAKRKKLDFQIKAIGSTLQDALGDIGSRALEKFNGGMAKGASLSERFENALKSKEGQKVLDGISTAVVSIADGAVNLATTLPRIGSFLSEHKTTLFSLGGAFLALKGASAIGGLAAKVKAAAGEKEGGGIMSLLGGGKFKGATPVYVVNNDSEFSGLAGLAGKGSKLGKLAGLAGTASSVLAAGAAGYAVGTALDDWLGISDKIGALGNKDRNGDSAAAKNEASVAKVIAARVQAGKETGYQAAIELERFARSAEGKKAGGALSPEVTALINALSRMQAPVIQVDGQTIAAVVSRHQERAVDTATARGAAPTNGG